MGLIPLKLRASVTVPGPQCSQAVPISISPSVQPAFTNPLFLEVPMRPVNLPYTQEQWRKLLDEVKGMYWDKQYEACCTRCREALDHVRGPVHPLHLIYLSFYAATCLEMEADTLKDASLEKASLLKLARTYYQRADSFMAQAMAEESSEDVYIIEQPQRIRRRASISFSSVRSISVASATGSNAESVLPTDNLFSPAPSPTSSISSFTSLVDQTPKLQPPRFKNRVQFQPSLPTVISVGSINEHALPPSPEKPTTSPLPVIEENKHTDPKPSFSPPQAQERYHTDLYSFRTRIKRHIVMVNARIFDCQVQRLRETKEEIPPPPGFERFDSMSSLQVEVGITDDDRRVKSAIRQARINELKERGEQHKKKGYFDGSRTKKLCEDALKELKEMEVRRRRH